LAAVPNGLPALDGYGPPGAGYCALRLGEEIP